MEMYRTKPDNQIVIVDGVEFDRIDGLAKLKEEEIEKRAKEKFLDYVKNSGIAISFRINSAPDLIRHKVVTELNYDERGWPESISDEVKHRIVDDITSYINCHFENYRTDCIEYLTSQFARYKSRHSKKIKLWKYLFYIALSAFLALCFYIAFQ